MSLKEPSKMKKEFILTDLGMASVYINKEEGLVVAVINEKKETNKVYKGIAKCNFDSGDIFDEDFGIELALLRMLTKGFTKIEKDRLKKYNDFCENMMKAERQVLKLSKSYRIAADRRELHESIIQEMIKSV